MESEKKRQVNLMPASEEQMARMTAGALAQHHIDEAVRLTLVAAVFFLGQRTEDGHPSPEDRSKAANLIRNAAKLLPWLEHEPGDASRRPLE